MIRNERGQFLKGHISPNRSIVDKICPVCGKIFRPVQSSQNTCSQKCGRETMAQKSRGRPRPADVRAKISRGHMGKIVSETTRRKQSEAKVGVVPWNKGIPLSEEAKKKMSESRRGDKSRWWKGGVSELSDLIRRSLKYRTWRTAVFTRDGYRCVWCGADKKYLNADHIKQMALILRENNIKTFEDALACEELWMINNGRTLCIDCHKETDSYLNKGKLLLK